MVSARDADRTALEYSPGFPIHAHALGVPPGFAPKPRPATFGTEAKSPQRANWRTGNLWQFTGKSCSFWVRPPTARQLENWQPVVCFPGKTAVSSATTQAHHCVSVQPTMWLPGRMAASCRDGLKCKAEGPRSRNRLGRRGGGLGRGRWGSRRLGLTRFLPVIRQQVAEPPRRHRR